MLVLFFTLLSPLLYAKSAEVSPALKKHLIYCSGCHGNEGVSVGNVIPNLAGQHASYIIKELHDYATGETRKNENMTQALKNLPASDYAKVAEFYASQPIPQGQTPQKYVKLGEQLYRGGDPSRQITACIACHGPRGYGNGPAKFPVLSGQKPEYTLQQLQNFKSHQRKNDLNGIMRNIAEKLTEKDMKALAHYCSGLH